jgi:hypothetical protein
MDLAERCLGALGRKANTDRVSAAQRSHHHSGGGVYNKEGEDNSKPCVKLTCTGHLSENAIKRMQLVWDGGAEFRLILRAKALYLFSFTTFPASSTPPP